MNTSDYAIHGIVHSNTVIKRILFVHSNLLVGTYLSEIFKTATTIKYVLILKKKKNAVT